MIVTNDEENIFVKYQLNEDVINEGWCITETHVHAGEALDDFPINHAGNPQIGNFAYKEKHDPCETEYTYEISWCDEYECDQYILIAAHALINNQSFYESQGIINGDEHESAWAFGDRFTEQGNWATYFTYTFISEPNGGNGEYIDMVAFAYGEQYANCFLEDPDLVSRRWGWTNGLIGHGTYEWDLWANVGSCDQNDGSLIGSVVVVYSSENFTVTFNLDDSYYLDEPYVYAGTIKLPLTTDGSPSAAPGHYYIEDPLTGDIYVIAFASVVQVL